MSVHSRWILAISSVYAVLAWIFMNNLDKLPAPLASATPYIIGAGTFVVFAVIVLLSIQGDIAYHSRKE